MVNIREVLSNQESLYIPIATNIQKGIAKFYNDHFDVIDGEVRIKQSYFRNLLTNEVNTMRLTSEYESDKLVQNLYGLDGQLVSTSEVTLPFSNYIDDVVLEKLHHGLILTYKKGNLSSSQQISLSEYANKATLEKDGNSLFVKLYNDDTLLCFDDVNLDNYANKLSVTKNGEQFVLSLLNDTNVLSEGTISLSEYFKNVEVARDGDDVTLTFANDSVVSTKTFNVEDVYNVKNSSIELSINSQTYVVTAYLKDKDGNIISQTSIDLPLESMVVGATEQDGSIILTLQNGSTTSFYIGDLVDGLVSQTTYEQDKSNLLNELYGIKTTHNQDKSYLLNELYDIKTQLGSYVNTVDSLIGEVE